MRTLWHRSRTEAAALHEASRKVPLLIRVLAAGKVLKGLGFLVAALGAAKIARVPDLQEFLMGLVERFHFDPEGQRIHQFLAWATDLSHDRLRLVAAGLFTYSAIYLIEGIGLWYDRPWAEWLVVIATGLFVPLEAEHLWHHPSLGTGLVLTINLAVVVFLARRIANRRRHQAA